MAEVSTIGAVFLAIFFLSLVGFYVAIRRKLLSTIAGGILCAVISSVTLVAFGILDDNIDDGLAVTGGLIVGLTFSGMMVTMAAYFLNNQPESLRAYEAMLQERKKREQEQQ